MDINRVNGGYFYEDDEFFDAVESLPTVREGQSGHGGVETNSPASSPRLAEEGAFTYDLVEKEETVDLEPPRKTLTGRVKQLGGAGVGAVFGAVYGVSSLVFGIIKMIPGAKTVGNVIHPPSREADSEMDRKVDKIAKETLPATLNSIIINALDFVSMKRVLTRYSGLKSFYETISRFIYERVLSHAGNAVTYGLDNLVKSLQQQLSKSREEKSEILTSIEKKIFADSAKSLAAMNRAYSDIEGLESLSEPEQTVAVLRYLQERGELHEAIAVLDLEEEKLWSKRGSYLKTGETVHDAIVRLEVEKETYQKELAEAKKKLAEVEKKGMNLEGYVYSEEEIAQLKELIYAPNMIRSLDNEMKTLKDLKVVELKIWEKESAYLMRIAEELFDKVLYPGNSFRSQLPLLLKPFAGFIKSKVVYSFAASLSFGVDTAADPSNMYKGIIGLAKPPEGGTPRSVEGRAVPIAESGEELFDLAKEVTRVGFPKVASGVGGVQVFAGAAHAVAGGMLGLLERGLNVVEQTGYFSSYMEGAKEYVQQGKEAVKFAEPDRLIGDMMGAQIGELHEKALSAVSTEEGLNDLLDELPNILGGFAAPKVISDENPWNVVERDRKTKELAMEVLRDKFKENFGEDDVALMDVAGPEETVNYVKAKVGNVALSGAEQMVNRFANKRLNKALIYGGAVNGVVRGLREI